ncbi:putative protein of unknown function [Aspergillus terreus]|uniref:DUF7582 domain-containing protein n=1 Tax=Aspergillus terreus TaxID=33178 RepID=A0A5M3YT18_ASPTE|nr:hypothetical protein ATETN484_0002018700 [Aspergillus terreus]GFF15043.1 putative protein of unknown function [Aspergillus terreus]
MGQSWSRLQQRRNASALRDLAPQKTPGHENPLPQLNRNTLLTALNNVASYIAEQEQNVTVIAVGGAVNTIYLQSRTATHDVDFFNNYLTARDFECLLKGAKAAARKDPLLEENWFNNRTILFIPIDQRATLTQQAFDQHEVIFSAPGLTVLAAPWQYAFCCKVDRMAGGGINSARSYDLEDAVVYLSRYFVTHRVENVQRTTVQSWFVQYSLRWTAANDDVITRVNAAYQARFQVGHQAIV